MFHGTEDVFILKVSFKIAFVGKNSVYRCT